MLRLFLLLLLHLLTAAGLDVAPPYANTTVSDVPTKSFNISVDGTADVMFFPTTLSADPGSLLRFTPMVPEVALVQFFANPCMNTSASSTAEEIPAQMRDNKTYFLLAVDSVRPLWIVGRRDAQTSPCRNGSMLIVNPVSNDTVIPITSLTFVSTTEQSSTELGQGACAAKPTLQVTLPSFTAASTTPLSSTVRGNFSATGNATSMPTRTGASSGSIDEASVLLAMIVLMCFVASFFWEYLV